MTSTVLPAVWAALTIQVAGLDPLIYLDILSLTAVYYITFCSTPQKCNEIRSAMERMMLVSLLASLREAGESFIVKESGFVQYKFLF